VCAREGESEKRERTDVRSSGKDLFLKYIEETGDRSIRPKSSIHH